MVTCQTLESVTVVTIWTSIHIQIQHYLEFNPSKEGKEHKISMLPSHLLILKGWPGGYREEATVQVTWQMSDRAEDGDPPFLNCLSFSHTAPTACDAGAPNRDISSPRRLAFPHVTSLYLGLWVLKARYDMQLWQVCSCNRMLQGTGASRNKHHHLGRILTVGLQPALKSLTIPSLHSLICKLGIPTPLGLLCRLNAKYQVCGTDFGHMAL